MITNVLPPFLWFTVYLSSVQLLPHNLTISQIHSIQNYYKCYLWSRYCYRERSNYRLTVQLLCPRPDRQWGIIKMSVGVCLSVCPSITCLIITRERKGLGSPRWKLRVTSQPIKRSKDQSPINAHTENAHYLPNGKIRTTRVKVDLKEFLKTDTISNKKLTRR